MWIHSKQSRQLAIEHRELEALVTARTAELQKLTQRLLKVQDEERRKIARDLHDSTGQTLAALKMSILFLQQSCTEDAPKLALISQVEALADQALEEIRTTSYLLHPPLLDEVGFACAAEWYIEGFSKRSGINVKANIASSRERLPRSMEIALFRVLQESLTNVHRHSGATEASINFSRQGEAVILEVRDFGKGIPEERLRLLRAVNADTGVGLAGMRERLHELNGELEIESDARGTSMRATVPLYAMAHPAPVEECASMNQSAQA
jgi:two-component system, NarL family, sensor kinase